MPAVAVPPDRLASEDAAHGKDVQGLLVCEQVDLVARSVCSEV